MQRNARSVSLRPRALLAALVVAACAPASSPHPDDPSAEDEDAKTGAGGAARTQRPDAGAGGQGGSGSALRPDTAMPPADGAADARSADSLAAVDFGPVSMDTADGGPAAQRLPHVILDTDADNEVDDQHALAYLLFNADQWIIDGVTTNHTVNVVGRGIAPHTAEARRVVKLCASADAVKVYTGAEGRFSGIRPRLQDATFDGKEAVDFIIARAKLRSPEDKLILLPIGKLTNIALALAKDPSIAPNVRVLWLGSNWPRGTDEHNERHDHEAVNFLMNSQVPFDIALVRYGVGGAEGGTAAVVVGKTELVNNVKGQGPKVPPVEGRKGGLFTTFGDYAVNLFEQLNASSRPLFDLAAVALVKDPTWATAQEVPAPIIEGGAWKARPDNPRKVRFYKGFNRNAIVADFFKVMKAPKLQPMAAN